MTFICQAPGHAQRALDKEHDEQRGDDEHDRDGGGHRIRPAFHVVENLDRQRLQARSGDEERNHDLIERDQKDSAALATKPGASSGKVTRRNTVSGAAPSMAAASSTDGGSVANAVVMMRMT